VKRYEYEVSVSAPYPITVKGVTERSTLGAIAADAARALEKDLRERKKLRRIDGAITIKLWRLENIPKEEEA